MRHGTSLTFLVNLPTLSPGLGLTLTDRYDNCIQKDQGSPIFHHLGQSGREGAAATKGWLDYFINLR